jgi:hypothetical protein
MLDRFAPLVHFLWMFVEAPLDGFQNMLVFPAGDPALLTRRPGLAGVLLVAPGHRPDRLAFENEAVLSKAWALIGKGEGNDEARIFNANQGRKITCSLAADIAVGFFNPEGLAVMQNAAPKVSPGTLALWIIGEDDRLHPKGRS